MKWAALATTFRTESLIGFIGVVLTATNAPVFQNVGTGDASSLEKWAVALFFGLLMLSALELFIGRLAFEYFCPQLIKQYGTNEAYIKRLGNMPQDAALVEAWEKARLAWYAEWKNANESEDMRWVVKLPLWAFLITLPAAFLLGMLSLWLFACG